MRATEACLLGLLALTLAGSWLRADPIARRPLWYDEACSWRVAASSDYGELLAGRSKDPKQPPLSFLLTKIAMALAGSESEAVLRMPSLLAGILCIPAAFWLGWSVRGPPVALLTALLVTVDPNMVSQSQQSRMFTLLMLATLVGLALGLALLRDPRRAGRGRAVALGIALALGFYANQLSLALWAGLALAGAWQLVRERPGRGAIARHPLVRALALAFGVAALLSLPGAAELGRILARNWGRSGSGSVAGALASLGDLFGAGAVAAGAALLAVAGIAALARERPQAARLLATTGVAAVAILVPFRRAHHFFDVRYLLMVQPSLWLGLACLPVCAGSRARRAGAAAVVLGLACALAWQSLHIESWWPKPGRFAQPLLFLELSARRAPGDAVLLVPRWISVLGRYYGVTQDPALEQAWYERPPGSAPAVPPDFEAPATWIVGGFLSWEVAREALVDAIALLAEHYGAEVDRARIATDLAADQHWLVRVSPAGIETWSALSLLDRRRTSAAGAIRGRVSAAARAGISSGARGRTSGSAPRGARA